MEEPGTPSRVCFSFAAYAKNVISHLRRCQVPIARGLTDEEFRRIESTFGFAFPPDLRSILQEGLPVGVGFPNWRSGQTQQLRMMMELPMAGICFEVSKGSFWSRHWGSRPCDPNSAHQLSRSFLHTKVPLLVPIFSHCYIPSAPNVAGNPIFFIFRKDIYYCGYDVADFFERQAFVPHNFKPPPEIPFEPQSRPTLDSGPSCDLQALKNPNPYPRLPKIITRKKKSKNADIAVPARKSVSEEASRSIERPETVNLVRSAGNSPRCRTSEPIISRYRYFHETPLSNTVLSQFTMRAPAWVAKAARKIEFWSELVESRDSLNVASEQMPFSSPQPTPEKHVRFDDESLQCATSKQWLTRYLAEIGSNLRRAGWNEEEISDMLNPNARCLNLCESKETFVENLATSMDFLSTSLRKAGWSAKEVFESLNLHHLHHSQNPGIRDLHPSAPHVSLPCSVFCT